MVFTVEELTEAIKRTSKDVKDADGMESASEKAERIMNILGPPGRSIDNNFNREERKIIYSLDKSGLVKSKSRSSSLFNGKKWRIHYWELDRQRIDALLEEEIPEDQDTDDEDVYEVWDEDHMNRKAGEENKIDYSPLLEKFDGFITEEDLELAEVKPQEIDQTEDKEDLKDIALRAGSKRKEERLEKWSYHLDKEEREEIREYLLREIKKRPDVTAHLFNKLMGIGYQTYFDSFNELRTKAGLEENVGSRRFEHDEGQEKLLGYCLTKTLDGETVTQKEIKEEFRLHVDSYGFEGTEDLKYSALEIVAFEKLREKPNLSLNDFSQRVGYEKKDIEDHMDFEYLRNLALLSDN